MKLKLLLLISMFITTWAYGGSSPSGNPRISAAAQQPYSYQEPTGGFESLQHQPYLQEQMHLDYEQAAAAQWGAPH
jgi:hypothetical protein